MLSSRRWPVVQVDRFWQQVGEELAMRIESESPRPVWLSTSGLGVSSTRNHNHNHNNNDNKRCTPLEY